MNQQKVWVIDDGGSSRFSGNSRSAAKPDPRKQVDQAAGEDNPDARTAHLESARKNPAWSFSLGILVWGCGHFYLGENRRGAIFMAAMLIIDSSVLSILLGRAQVFGLLSAHPEQTSLFLVAFAALSLVGLILWIGNAVDAYLRTARFRSESFPEVKNAVWPMGISLIFPGWGQILNGQLKKGLLFLLVGVLGLFSLEVILTSYYFWPLIKSMPVRIFIDYTIAATMLLIPLAPVIWLTAAYDAFWTAQRLLRQRFTLRPPGLRARWRGVERSPVPRSTAVLSLLLAISLGMQFIPKGFYVQSLEKVRVQMVDNNLEKSPELLHEVLKLLAR